MTTNTSQAATLRRHAAEASAEAAAWEASTEADAHLVKLRRRDAALLERRARAMASSTKDGSDVVPMKRPG